MTEVKNIRVEFPVLNLPQFYTKEMKAQVPAGLVTPSSAILKQSPQPITKSPKIKQERQSSLTKQKTKISDGKSFSPPQQKSGFLVFDETNFFLPNLRSISSRKDSLKLQLFNIDNPRQLPQPENKSPATLHQNKPEPPPSFEISGKEKSYFDDLSFLLRSSAAQFHTKLNEPVVLPSPQTVERNFSLLGHDRDSEHTIKRDRTAWDITNTGINLLGSVKVLGRGRLVFVRHKMPYERYIDEYFVRYSNRDQIAKISEFHKNKIIPQFTNLHRVVLKFPWLDADLRNATQLRQFISKVDFENIQSGAKPGERILSSNRFTIGDIFIRDNELIVKGKKTFVWRPYEYRFNLNQAVDPSVRSLRDNAIGIVKENADPERLSSLNYKNLSNKVYFEQAKRSFINNFRNMLKEGDREFFINSRNALTRSFEEIKPAEDKLANIWKTSVRTERAMLGISITGTFLIFANMGISSDLDARDYNALNPEAEKRNWVFGRRTTGATGRFVGGVGGSYVAVKIGQPLTAWGMPQRVMDIKPYRLTASLRDSMAPNLVYGGLLAQAGDYIFTTTHNVFTGKRPAPIHPSERIETGKALLHGESSVYTTLYGCKAGANVTKRAGALPAVVGCTIGGMAAPIATDALMDYGIDTYMEKIGHGAQGAMTGLQLGLSHNTLKGKPGLLAPLRITPTLNNSRFSKFVFTANKTTQKLLGPATLLYNLGSGGYEDGLRRGGSFALGKNFHTAAVSGWTAAGGVMAGAALASKFSGRLGRFGVAMAPLGGIVGGIIGQEWIRAIYDKVPAREIANRGAKSGGLKGLLTDKVFGFLADHQKKERALDAQQAAKEKQFNEAQAKFN